MKYSRLPQIELQKLEKDFINFLIVNGITSDDWKEIQKDEVRTDGILDAFSDVIWEGVLVKIQYLINIDSKLIYLFHFTQSKAQLLILQAKSPIFEIEQWMNDDSALNIEFQEKGFQESREMDIFKLMQQGCQIVEKEIYQHFALKYADARFEN